MKVLFFFAKKYDREFQSAALSKTGSAHTFDYVEGALGPLTVSLAKGYDAVSIFPNDSADKEVLLKLAEYGIKLILLRCAGFNNVDLKVAEELGITLLRVPSYSPEAVAEHAVGLALTLSRKYHRAYNRTREHNFALDGLLGFNFFGKTVGILGTGKIGEAAAKIFKGFGCTVIANDVYESESVKALGIKYVSLDELCAQSDVISIHAPLLPSTRHIIDAKRLAQCKQGVVIVNTSRGPLIENQAVIDALKSGKVGSLGLDVVEGEEGLFFNDVSDSVVFKDDIALLMSFPNVLVTAHQAFFTREALEAIAATTVQNLLDYVQGKPNPQRLVTAKMG